MVNPGLRSSCIRVGAKKAFPVEVDQVRRGISYPYLGFPGNLRKVTSQDGPVGESGHIDQPSRCPGKQFSQLGVSLPIHRAVAGNSLHQ